MTACEEEIECKLPKGILLMSRGGYFWLRFHRNIMEEMTVDMYINSFWRECY